jgi:catechol 2,3-dioxygenase-like lactoylglutathione lyase family enzyme
VIRRIQHVQLAAPPGCEDAARTFFGALLGLEEVSKPQQLAAGGGVWFALAEGQELHVGIERDHRPAGKAHPALEVTGRAALEELAARLASAGHPVSWDDRIRSVHRFHTADPWGNRLELQAPAAGGDP